MIFGYPVQLHVMAQLLDVVPRIYMDNVLPFAAAARISFWLPLPGVPSPFPNLNHNLFAPRPK